jgi:hypothetical protein
MNTKTLLPILLVPSCIVAIPAVAMAFQAEGWAWSGFDFVAMWVLIAGAVAAYKFVASQVPDRAYRAAAGLAVIAGLVLVWMNGAVGLIGSEDNPANLLYGGVLLVGVAGAVIARLQPLGMAWALWATAAAQLLVPVVAFILWRPDFSPGVMKVFLLNSGFVLTFAASAQLFRHAASRSDRAGLPTPA